MTALPVMHPVQSSNLAAIGHDGADLYVRFRNGTTYRYRGVSAQHFTGIKGAASPGGYFHRAIVAARHPAEKVEG